MVATRTCQQLNKHRRIASSWPNIIFVSDECLLQDVNVVCSSLTHATRTTYLFLRCSAYEHLTLLTFSHTLIQLNMTWKSVVWVDSLFTAFGSLSQLVTLWLAMSNCDLPDHQALELPPTLQSFELYGRSLQCGLGSKSCRRLLKCNPLLDSLFAVIERSELFGLAQHKQFETLNLVVPCNSTHVPQLELVSAAMYPSDFLLCACAAEITNVLWSVCGTETLDLTVHSCTELEIVNARAERIRLGIPVVQNTHMRKLIVSANRGHNMINNLLDELVFLWRHRFPNLDELCVAARFRRAFDSRDLNASIHNVVEAIKWHQPARTTPFVLDISEFRLFSNEDGYDLQTSDIHVDATHVLVIHLRYWDAMLPHTRASIPKLCVYIIA